MSQSKKAKPPVTVTRAQPPAAAAKARPPVAGESNPPKELDTTGAHTVFLQSQEKLGPYAPSESALDRFKAQIAKETAIDHGGHIASDLIIYDAMTDLPLVLDVVIAGAIEGFGPREAHDTVGLALELDAGWQSLQGQQVQKAGASNAKELTFSAASKERTRLLNLLEAVVTPGSSEDASLRKAASLGGKTLSKVAEGLQAVVRVARGLLAAAATDPSLGEFLGDQGLTTARVDEAAAYSARLSSAAPGHAQARSDVGEGQDGLSELDGRLRDQLLRLRKAVEQARAKGVKVPEVPLANIRALYRSSRPEPAAAPAPSPSALTA